MNTALRVSMCSTPGPQPDRSIAVPSEPGYWRLRDWMDGILNVYKSLSGSSGMDTRLRTEMNNVLEYGILSMASRGPTAELPTREEIKSRCQELASMAVDRALVEVDPPQDGEEYWNFEDEDLADTLHDYVSNQTAIQVDEGRFPVRIAPLLPHATYCPQGYCATIDCGKGSVVAFAQPYQWSDAVTVGVVSRGR